MSELDLVVRASRAVTATGTGPCAVGVRDGVIVSIAAVDTALDARREVVLGPGEVLLPGIVDSHVHVNDPGRTEWEGFSSATRAAAAGGVTTIVDMPLNSIPPTVDVEALRVKQSTAAPQAWVDVAFWGGAVPGNVSHLRGLHDAGVAGFKCFLLHSGVDEFPPLDAARLEEAMVEIASFGGLLIVHAEDEGCIDGAPQVPGPLYDDFLASRPGEAETLAVGRVIDLAKATGCRVHVLHVSSAAVLPLIDDAKRAGVPITAETCPHYLTFDAETIPDGGTQYKCCPPIRDRSNRDALWEGLRRGTIDLVVTDHSPSTVELKALDTGDFGVAWGGIASLQLGLSAVWTEARQRGFELEDVVGWMAGATARLAGLPSKGVIAVGGDADFCVFAPDESFVVDARRLHHKNPITPYDGRTLAGVVHQAWLRGAVIDVAAEPAGQLLRRGSDD